jgi:hypothetical protein
MTPLIKKIIAGAAIVIVLFALYRIFFGGPEEAPLSSETPSGLPAGEEGDLLSLLLELRSITLSGAIFSDAAFQTLQDFTVNLVPEPVGRRNPFAPIGAASAANSGSTTEPL